MGQGSVVKGHDQGSLSEVRVSVRGQGSLLKGHWSEVTGESQESLVKGHWSCQGSRVSGKGS